MKNKNNHIDLDKLPKKQLYSVPDGYFDELPGIIQNRITSRAGLTERFSFNWTPALKVALPLVTLALMIAYFAVRIDRQEFDVEAMIAEIPTEDLIEYISESDLTTDELLSLIDIEELDLDGMIDEDASLLNDDELDYILEEYSEFDLENDI